VLLEVEKQERDDGARRPKNKKKQKKQTKQNCANVPANEVLFAARIDESSFTEMTRLGPFFLFAAKAQIDCYTQRPGPCQGCQGGAGDRGRIVVAWRLPLQDVAGI
jgi:hypothetical protein